MEMSKMTLEIFSKLEQKWLYQCEGKKTRVLSVDGGRTTDIVSGTALVHLEDQIQAKTGDSTARIADYFNIVVGTGIGALLAAMLVADDGSGRPLFSAKEAAKFVADNQAELFKSRSAGIFPRRTMFSSKSMDKVLKEAFCRDDGTVLTLKDTCKPLLCSLEGPEAYYSAQFRISCYNPFFVGLFMAGTKHVIRSYNLNYSSL